MQLAQACRALWIATLSLMTAFMQQQAPAHRYLLARRIGRNLETLAGQDCFDAPCRARFARLARQRHNGNHVFGGNMILLTAGLDDCEHLILVFVPVSPPARRLATAGFLTVRSSTAAAARQPSARRCQIYGRSGRPAGCDRLHP